jgi:hypothetical protein
MSRLSFRLLLASRSLMWGGLAWLSVLGAHAAEATEAGNEGRKPVISVGEPAPQSTKVYRYLNGGTVSFSDRPPGHDQYVILSYGCFACNPKSTINWNVTRLFRTEFAYEIEGAAREFNLDPALVRAVIHAESGFNVHARSPKGAIGLMQLMPSTAKLMGVSNPRLPQDNIQGGARYLAQLMSRFKSDITLVSAAYNAGPEAVQKHAGVPPYPETQVYVQRVRILLQRYRDMHKG